MLGPGREDGRTWERGLQDPDGGKPMLQEVDVRVERGGQGRVALQTQGLRLGIGSDHGIHQRRRRCGVVEQEGRLVGQVAVAAGSGVDSG